MGNQNLLFWITICAVFTTGLALKCHICRSTDDRDCADPWDTGNTKYLKECDQQKPVIVRDETGKNVTMRYTYCRKMTNRVALTGVKDEEYRVIRGCGAMPDKRINFDSEDGKGSCYRKPGTFEVEVYYCGCNEEGCNSAFSLKVETATTIFLTLAGIVIHQIMVKF